MKAKFYNLKSFRWLAIASCLGLTISLQAFAQQPLQQPGAITNANLETPAKQNENEEVTPVGCTDSCCGGSCATGNCNGKDCCSNGCCNKYICCPKLETEEVKKHYWTVKSKMICIPGYRFECNWRKNKCSKGSQCCDSGCTDSCCSSDACCSGGACGEKCPCYDPGKPTCGRVRCIKVLEKHDYTCDKCGYEWEVKCVRSGKGRSCCGKNGCCCPSCGCASKEATEELGQKVELTSATEEAPAEAPDAKKSLLSKRLKSWLK